MFSDEKVNKLLADVAELLKTVAEEWEERSADRENDLAHLKACVEAQRYLRALFAEYGIDDRLNWPDWIAAIRKHLDAISSKGA